MTISGCISRCCGPRIVAVIVILAALAILPGCWVYSVEPLYEERLFSHPDPDLTFDQNLLGSWWHTDTDNNCLWTLTFAAHQQAYELTMAPASNCKGEEKTSKYEGHLVKLDNHRFLDIGPESTEVCDLCLPRHSFFLLTQEADTLALIPVDDEWLKDAIAQDKVTLAHLSDSLTLTATSKDLKAFVRKYADDKAAFKPDPNFAFKRK